MREDGQRMLPSLPKGRVGADATLWCLALVCGCFTLTSEAYIEWLYRLIELGPSAGADWHALVGNYVCQGVGMLLATMHAQRQNRAPEQPLLLIALVLHASFAIPAALASTTVASLVFGSLMALCSGFIQFFYLTQLSSLVEPGCRGVVFGLGYACSSGLTWLLSLMRGVVGQRVPFGLVTCVTCSMATAALVLLVCPVGTHGLQPTGETDAAELDGQACEVASGADDPSPSSSVTHGITALACAAVLLMSAEKSLGFGFPPADIQLGVSVEFSRLFYAAGLVVAGIATDYNRSCGVVCGMAALVTPFAMLALSGETIPLTVLWSLDYLLYGFFALFRVMLFLDSAESEDKVYMAGLGLMLGRFGDAAGNALYLALGGNNVALVGLAGVMLVCALVMALQLFPQIYASEPTIVYRPAPRSAEEDRLGRFSQYFDLSRREREVLGQVLARRTNVEAAEELFVSESTIKFHMRNLLRKTGCKNRVELRNLYADWH